MRTFRRSFPFPARYSAACDDCGDRITPGDLIVKDGSHVAHDVCPGADEPITETCPACHLAVSVSGACGCES